MTSDGTLRPLPRGTADAVREPRAVRLLGRLPAARRRPGRPRARPARRSLPVGACPTRSRARTRCSSPTSCRPGSSPCSARRRPRRHRRRGRLRAGRADGDAVRGRRGAARDRRRRRSPRDASSPRSLGAEAVEPADARDVVAAATAGIGADERDRGVGVAGCARRGVAARARAGHVSVVGAHFEPDFPLNNALMFEKEITLRFAIGDPSPTGSGCSRWSPTGR